MSRIRVGYVIGSLDVGGTERQLFELASRLDRTRFEPRIFCLSHEGAHADAARSAGVAVASFGVGPLPLLRWRRWTLRLRRLCADVPLDVLHAFLFPSYALAALAVRGLQTKVVAGVRAIGVGREGNWPFSLLDASGLRRADRIVVNAEAVRRALCRRYGGVDEKTLVIPNGIDPASYQLSGNRGGIPPKLGLPATAFVVLMVANLIPYKGHQDAIQALGLLRRRVPGAVLALAGAGPHETRLRSLVRGLGLEDSVMFLGQRSDVPQLLAASDVVLLCSSEEGMPNALLEAMAASRPVVATFVGGVPELVVQDVTGLLVPPGDVAAIESALVRVASDGALARSLGEAGRRRVCERFTWDSAVRAHEELYAALCGRG